jgi:methyl-accepting chemotaxis protein
MKDYNNNSNPSWKEVRGQTLNAKETVGTIQHISKNIRDYSLRMRETMNTLRESGAIPELAEAIREASFAVRDTAKDITEATRELKKNCIVELRLMLEKHHLTQLRQCKTVLTGLKRKPVK